MIPLGDLMVVKNERKAAVSTERERKKDTSAADGGLEDTRLNLHEG